MLFNNFERNNGLLVFMAMSLIPAVYGCVHLGALGVMFPTWIEQLLWKIACYVLVGSARIAGQFGYLHIQGTEV
jgi:hypothetical protein